MTPFRKTDKQPLVLSLRINYGRSGEHSVIQLQLLPAWLLLAQPAHISADGFNCTSVAAMRYGHKKSVMHPLFSRSRPSRIPFQIRRPLTCSVEDASLRVKYDLRRVSITFLWITLIATDLMRKLIRSRGLERLTPETRGTLICFGLWYGKLSNCNVSNERFEIHFN